MTKSEALLTIVSNKVRAEQEARVRLKAEADAWIEKQIASESDAVDRAVLAALADKHSVSAVARAYTISGLTPNRNAIYDIKRKHADRITVWVGEYPFAWESRIIETRTGERIVYDIVSQMIDFGPEVVTGSFRWRFDKESQQPELLTFPDDPDVYPSSGYYTQVLTKWLSENPYPEGD